MRLALDTNRYTDLQAGDRDVAKVLEKAAEIFLPFIVVAELRAGFSLGARGRENERKLGEFLGEQQVTVLYPDNQTSFHFASLYRQLREQGTPIPDHDVWIAALALQHNLTLYSRDGHFDCVPQLARV